ncbi:MAG: M15 family metallopeptidase [Colwellia sp.]|nr:M15 family metallopeptidase [Colwellia sp.]
MSKGFKLTGYSLKYLATVKSKALKYAVEEFIKVTPIDFCIIKNGGYRTAEEQKELFDKGNSKCDGYQYKSRHQSGMAVDLVPWINGKPTWDKFAALEIAKAFYFFCKGQGLNVRSGADWNEQYHWVDFDPYHYEVKE